MLLCVILIVNERMNTILPTAVFGVVESDDHVINAEFFVLLIGPLVDLNLDLGVLSGRERVVDEAVGKGVVKDECEWLVSLHQLFHLANELSEFVTSARVSFAEGVCLFQMIDNFL